MQESWLGIHASGTRTPLTKYTCRYASTWDNCYQYGVGQALDWMSHVVAQVEYGVYALLRAQVFICAPFMLVLQVITMASWTVFAAAP